MKNRSWVVRLVIGVVESLLPIIFIAFLILGFIQFSSLFRYGFGNTEAIALSVACTIIANCFIFYFLFLLKDIKDSLREIQTTLKENSTKE